MESPPLLRGWQPERSGPSFPVVTGRFLSFRRHQRRSIPSAAGLTAADKSTALRNVRTSWRILMGIIEWAQTRTDAMTIWDVGALKIYCVLFGVIVGAYIPMFVRERLWRLVLSVVVLGLGVGYRWFTAEPH
jgi:hypothetical protein